MSANLNITAHTRTDLGKGAVRRLRATGHIPGIVYGGGEEAPQSIKIRHDDIMHRLENETFYSSILRLELDGNKEKVVLKEVQRHPAKIDILHVDLQRVSSTSEITMNIPVHFLNTEEAKGVKLGGEIDVHYNEVEIKCMAKDLPESFEIDLIEFDIGDSFSLSQIDLPEGVTLTAFIGATEEEMLSKDQMVVQVIEPRIEEEEPEETEEVAEGEEGEEGTEAGAAEGEEAAKSDEATGDSEAE